MTDRTLRELHADCLCSLNRYFCEAHRTCKLLLALEKFPASFEERQAIAEQRQAEDAAFQDYYYYSAREELLEVASCDGAQPRGHECLVVLRREVQWEGFVTNHALFVVGVPVAPPTPCAPKLC